MNKDQIREELKARLQEYVESVTTHSKGKAYVCPLCGSGTRRNKTGAFSLTEDGTRWKCFSCNEGGDLFDLIGKINKTLDHNEQMRLACAFFHVHEHEYTHADTHTHKKASATRKAEGEEDYTSFFEEARSHIEETDYPKRRGLSSAIVKRFGLGFVAQWRHPKAPAAPASPRLIIPTSKGSYLARDTRESLTDEQLRYSKQKAGKTHIFNGEALKSGSPVFVVEGEIDALSIIEVGGQAVALGSVSMVDKFLHLLEAEKPASPLIVALDNDDAGQRAAEKLLQGAKERGFFAYRHHLSAGKDANDALLKDREGLKRNVEHAIQIAIDLAYKHKEEEEDERQARREEYRRTSAGGHIKEFLGGIAAGANTPAIDTGFFQLNQALGDSNLEANGGLYEGLYIVGAISSLGKTTFCMQMADQIAQQGQDVLIFSLEMARTEIMSRSISRITCQLVISRRASIELAKTARGITTGDRYKRYSREEKELIRDAVKEYARYADRIYIQEGIGDIGVDQVRAAVAEHVKLTGNYPVVIVDYVQLLAPYSERATDKQNTDKAVLELKRISRDFKIPVVGISSFNRASYKEAVTMEAFKESGAIEYSSDVLIGLQLAGAGEKNFDVNAAKIKNPREVELVVLKNRNGKTGSKVSFKYFPMFNYFSEK